MSAYFPTPQQLCRAHPKVRDLFWAISSLPLLKSSFELPMTSDDFWLQQTTLAKPLLSKLIDNPNPLLASLSKNRSTKIGLIFEDLLLFWFKHHPVWELVAHDEQIFKKRETIGALDFVIQTEKSVLHLEVAIKFYLCQHDSSAWENWVGPSLKDNLNKKMMRIRHHQLPLGNRAETQTHFKYRNMSTPTESLGLIKGVFFGRWGHPLVAPHFGKIPSGTWLFADELQSYLLDKEDFVWVERHRPDWIAPWLSEQVNRSYTHQELEFIRVIKPRMFSTVVKKDGLWTEIERIVIVPNHWSPP